MKFAIILLVFFPNVCFSNIFFETTCPPGCSCTPVEFVCNVQGLEFTGKFFYDGHILEQLMEPEIKFECEDEMNFTPALPNLRLENATITVTLGICSPLWFHARELDRKLYRNPNQRVEKLKLTYQPHSILNKSMLDPFPNLKNLYLWENDFEEIEENALSGLRKLERFTIEMNGKRLKPPEGLLQENKRIREVQLYFSRQVTIPDRLLANLPGLLNVTMVCNLEFGLPQNIFENSPAITRIELNGILLGHVTRQLFKDQRNLEKVVLRGNWITGIDDESFPASIKSLNLRHNKLAQITERSFKSLENLLTLDLGKNKIESIHSNAFADLKSLHTLYLEKNRLFFTTNNATVFSKLPNLRLLNLGYNQIQHFSLVWTSKAMNLEQLILSGNPINSSNNLPLMVAQLPKMRTLHLIRTNLMGTFPLGWTARTPELELLELSGNQNLILNLNELHLVVGKELSINYGLKNDTEPVTIVPARGNFNDGAGRTGIRMYKIYVDGNHHSNYCSRPEGKWFIQMQKPC